MRREFVIVFGRPRELALLAAALTIGLLVLSARLAALPAMQSMLGVSGACAAVGFAVERTLARRLRFHSSEGILAVAALAAKGRRSYRGAWHGVGLLAIGATLALAWSPAMLAGLTGYGGGGVLNALLRPALALLPRTEGLKWVRARNLRGRAADRLWAGAIAGIVSALLLLAFAGPTSTPSAIAVMAAATLLAALLLVPADVEAIRFEGEVGKPVSFSLSARTRAAAEFVVSAATVAAVASAYGAALAALVVGTAVLVLQTVRTGLYRVHSKRAADILFAELLATGALVLMTLPPLIVPAAPLVVWWVSRRASAKRWLLAR